jgi:alcohol dehydrogenase YqhD (iron-dependent ADH family)
MLDFTYRVSTKILFGKNTVERLGDELRHQGNRVLLVYGQGSIRKTGLYDRVTNIFIQNSIIYHELPGVQPNPRISHVRQGIRLCKEHDIDYIIAVGGGSVIDCAKTIAAGFYHEGDPWELFLLGDSAIRKALPIGTILTIAGTGSEMNGNAVISNEETEEKRAIHHDILRPRFSILDPTCTFSVPKDQTAAGIVDIYSHVLEQYFSPTTEAFVQDRLAEGLLHTCIYYGQKAVVEPTNYEARAQLMWTSSLALNGLLGYGRITDWATHGMEHALSAMYDVTHGIGLAILTPFWMEYVLNKETIAKFVEYAHRVWQVKGNDELAVAKKGIKKTREFFTSLGMPQTLRDVGVKEEKLSKMAEKTVLHGDIGKFKKLEKSDVLAILKNAY